MRITYLYWAEIQKTSSFTWCGEDYILLSFPVAYFGQIFKFKY